MVGDREMDHMNYFVPDHEINHYEGWEPEFYYQPKIIATAKDSNDPN